MAKSKAKAGKAAKKGRPAGQSQAVAPAQRSSKREMKAATQHLEAQLKEMQAKLRELMIEAGDDPDAMAVHSAREFAEQMQEINRGFLEALKKAMMADGKIKPGQVLTIRGRRVFLKPRPGCPEGSMNPERYDLTYEMIH